MEKIAEGIYKLSFGKPENKTPVSILNNYVRHDELEKLPDVEIPYISKSIFYKQTRKGCVLEIPLKKDEQVFGLGLQLKSINQTNSKKHLRCNADPNIDSGDSHAPVPFYVSTLGYGVYIDTARNVTFNFGNGRKLADSVLQKEKKRVIADNTDDLYKVSESQDNRSVVIEIPCMSGVEIYIFAGPDMLTAVKRYNLFSGGGCLPPYWGLGIWYRAYGRATREECIKIAETFRKDNIPCDVFGLEPGWQTHSYSCSYIWNKENFPLHNEFMDTMKNNNYKINLWEHAFVHPKSPVYDKLKPYSGDYEVWNGLVPDFAIDEARSIFASYHKNELIDKGIDGFKADECDGSDFTGFWSYPDCSEFPSGLDGEQMHNMLGIMYQKTFDEAFRESGKRTYGSVRASYALAAGYPYVLYSDLYDMKDFVRGLVNMGYSGLLWTPEVRQCDSCEELIKRTAAVIFSPAALINCWMIPNPPWYQFDCEKNKKGEFLDNMDEITEIIKKLFRLRMSLIPYLYSAFFKYRETGHPPFRSLVMDNPDDKNTYNIEDEYMMGDSLLVAPVFCGTNTRKVYLPEGNWYDFYTNKKYSGKSVYEIEADWDKIPVFVKEGNIVPIAEPVEFITEDTVFNITVKCYGENCNDFDLISDDGISYDFEKCKYSVVRLSAEGCSNIIKSDYRNRYNIEKYVYIKVK